MCSYCERRHSSLAVRWARESSSNESGMRGSVIARRYAAHERVGPARGPLHDQRHLVRRIGVEPRAELVLLAVERIDEDQRAQRRIAQPLGQRAVRARVAGRHHRPGRSTEMRAGERGRDQRLQVGPCGRLVGGLGRLGRDEQGVRAAGGELRGQTLLAPGLVDTRVEPVHVDDDAGRAAIVAGGPEQVHGPVLGLHTVVCAIRLDVGGDAAATSRRAGQHQRAEQDSAHSALSPSFTSRGGA